MYTIQWYTQHNVHTINLNCKSDKEALSTAIECLQNLIHLEHKFGVHYELYLQFTESTGRKRPILSYYGQCI